MDDIARHLKPFALPRLIKVGGNIIFQGEIPRRGYLIRDGLVRAYTITSTGEERIVGIYGKGDIFPVTWLLNETSNALFYYDAVSDTRLLAVSKTDFTEHVIQNAALTPQLLKYLSNQYTSSLIRITGLEQPRAIEKVGFILYYLLFRYGVEKQPGIYSITLKLSHLMIANLIGVTRESTTAHLRMLQSKGVIDYDRNTYTVDKAKLESFLGEDSFRDITLG